MLYGAGGRNRTDTLSPEPDFESGASTSSTTPADGSPIARPRPSAKMAPRYQFPFRRAQQSEPQTVALKPEHMVEGKAARAIVNTMKPEQAAGGVADEHITRLPRRG